MAWDAVTWTKVDEPSLFTKAEVEKLKSLDPASYAVFRLTSPNGDQGYPGTLTAETVLALVKPGEDVSLGAVTIVYRAKLDDEATVTPVNLTQVMPPP